MIDDQTTFGQLHSGRVNDPQPATTEYESMEDQLSRAIYENGFSAERNFIEVWRSSDDDDGLINILCGHCDQVVSPKINSGHFCCHFAADMYKRYFEDKLVRR